MRADVDATTGVRATFYGGTTQNVNLSLAARGRRQLASFEPTWHRARCQTSIRDRAGYRLARTNCLGSRLGLVRANWTTLTHACAASPGGGPPPDAAGTPTRRARGGGMGMEAMQAAAVEVEAAARVLPQRTAHRTSRSRVSLCEPHV